MHLTHLIIDDFLPNAVDARNQALSMTYPPRKPDENFPGRNASQALNFADIEKLIGQIVHEELAPVAHLSHQVPRLALEGDTSNSHVHLDNCHWSGLLYLSLDEHCQGGTHFFRHKKTGWDMAPIWPGMAEKAGYSSSQDAISSILKDDIYDAEKWTETMMIPMRFNRLVIFRGYKWHDAGVSFGTEPENGRLIIPFFFRNTNPNMG